MRYDNENSFFYKRIGLKSHFRRSLTSRYLYNTLYLFSRNLAVISTIPKASLLVCRNFDFEFG